MNILYVCGFASHPILKGPQLHFFETLEFMSKSNSCRVIGFSFNKKPNLENETNFLKRKYPKVKSFELFSQNFGIHRLINIFFCLINFLPLSFSRWHSKSFSNKLKKILNEQNFDIIHFVDFVSVAYYSKFINNKKTLITLPDPQSNVILQELIHNQKNYFQNILKFYNYFSNLFFEKRFLRNFDKIICVSKQDQKYLKKFGFNNLIYIPFHIPLEIVNKKYSKNIINDFLIIRPYGNFLDNINGFLKSLINSFPNLKFTIISNQIHNQIHKNVKLINWVDDYFDEVSKHKYVLILDPYGTGASTRVVSAMALGIPVVGNKTAFRGLKFKQRYNCFLVSNVPTYDEISKVIKDQSSYNEVKKNAKNEIFKSHNFTKVMNLTKTLYKI